MGNGIGKLLDSLIGGLVFMGEIETNILKNAGKVTTVTNGKITKVERFGKALSSETARKENIKDG